MDPDTRRDLITRNTAEVVTDDELDDLTAEEDVSAYIGYAPTGMMHIGHFTTVRKIADFIQAGVDVTFLLADIHAELDVEKSPQDLIPARTEYYEAAVTGMLSASGVDPDAVTFVHGSDFQHDADYQKEYIRIMENVTVNRAQRAVNEVVRHSDSMKASGLLYAAMQVMDCAALDVDIAYAGLDQRRIYMLGREVLPAIGEDKPTCVFAPLLSGLSGGKMSASDAESKISIHDDRGTVHDKIGEAYCPAGETEDNGVLEYLQYLVFPVLDRQDTAFTVERDDEYGGDVTFDTYEDLAAAYTDGDIHPADLKPAAADAVADLLQPVQDQFEGNADLLNTAYPDEYDA